MSADELTLETPERTHRGWLRPALLMALPLALAWWVAFAITGLLWWSASGHVEQVPPPKAPALEAVSGADIDLDRYARAHPSWTP